MIRRIFRMQTKKSVVIWNVKAGWFIRVQQSTITRFVGDRRPRLSTRQCQAGSYEWNKRL